MNENTKDIIARADFASKILQAAEKKEARVNDAAKLFWEELGKQKLALPPSENTVRATETIIEARSGVKTASASGPFEKRTYDLLLALLSIDPPKPAADGEVSPGCQAFYLDLMRAFNEYKQALMAYTNCARVNASGSIRLGISEADSMILGNQQSSAQTGGGACGDEFSRFTSAVKSFNAKLRAYKGCEGRVGRG